MSIRSVTALLAVVFASAAGAQASKPAEPAFTKADVEFMQDMMHHHAQAIELCDLAPGRASAPVTTMCGRIHISQQDEIERMSNWLKKRGQEAPEVLGHHHGALEALEHSSMPGMVTPAQMNELARLRGGEFERLFLTRMIAHHEGAITMVKKLFDARGSGQGSELFAIASGIESDQRAEIDRMKKLIEALPPKQ